MIPFCGRCGGIFRLLDLTVVVPGAFRRHYVVCPAKAMAMVRQMEGKA
jgi:hypothetical protein